MRLAGELADSLHSLIHSSIRSFAQFAHPLDWRAPGICERMTGWDSYAPFYDWENARTLGRRDLPFWKQMLGGLREPALEEHVLVATALEHHRPPAQRAEDPVAHGQEVVERAPLADARQQLAIRARDTHGPPADDQPVVSHTDTCIVLSAVNASRRHPPQRSRNRIPAIRAIRSSSDGHT